jgi:uncharacterized lipoprotein YddW (UPF0748 family)
MHRILVIIFLFASFSATAQLPVKREFRAGWIATVSNIDWPSKPGLPAMQQQQEFIHRLDQLKGMGCNAVIVQVRPASDALYASSIEPWSRYLTGRQGQPPFPYYDPLVFMVEEAHKRNMELHAWFNPFRALTDSKKNPNPANHVTRTHPDWIISYGGKSQLDPGIPEAREYVINVIMDVVRRYDIDGVHLDDYFYPYRIAGQEFGDYKTYNRYGRGLSKDDWRRNNIDVFISTLYTNIKHEKSYVKFGVSPFGVWRNKSKDPEGSPTRGGQTCYDDLYANILLWQQKGWIDYAMPQLYWEHGHHAAAFDVLLPWWEAHKYNRHMYYGLGVYRMAEPNKGVWAGTREIMSQLRDIRNTTGSGGYCFYSTSSFDKISPAVRDSVDRFNVYYALPPLMKWLDSAAPPPPLALKAIPSSQGTLLKWQSPETKEKPIRFVVYRFINNEAIDLNRAERIISVQSGTEFLDNYANKYKQCKYVITSLDRLWNESRPGTPVQTNIE